MIAPIEAYLVALIIAVASGLGGVLYGHHTGYVAGEAHQKAQDKDLQDAITTAANAAAKQNAVDVKAAFASLEGPTKTIYHETKLQPIYTECKHSPDTFKALQEAADATR